jgi:superfamily II DNA or RNA helicase
MKSSFYTNYSDIKFIDKLKECIDHCQAFYFSVSFIKKPGLRLLAPNIEAAISRGASGHIITSTYQNFTDIDSLVFFHDLENRYPDRFSCRLDRECFCDANGVSVGFHSKGYLFEFVDHNELLVGSSNITVYALLKNIEWDVSVVSEEENETFEAAKKEFDSLWKQTLPLTKDLIDEYKTRLFYSIERWDMDYDIANSEIKPNYMQRRALKELNRVRAMGATKALVTASAGSGKTFLAAFDALNFNPRRLLYIVHEGSILMKSYETFQRVFGSDRSYGIYNAEYKEFDADFVFSTNVTMANSLDFFDKHTWDYVIIDECHHATAETYQKIITYFEPQFLLGITATPERMDGEDVFSLFDQNVPYELRLRDAIINGLVVPFKYYGIRDELIEYGLKETKGHKFVEQFSDEKHVDFISHMIEVHRLPGQKLKALAFCRDISHAIRMSQAMEEYYHTAYLTGKNTVGERVRAYKDLQNESADLEILFTVDILNEGVDIPGVNMVLFLRPTDSQTIFIQQLGRGLRKYEGKKYVTVLDFIGNDYKRSVQIAFALGSLSENFVVEKKLIAALIADNFASIGLADYGVEIHLDDLSKKEILSFIDEVNFNTKIYLAQDYFNFKRYISAASWPQHVDYLNNDYAPDLIKFMQSRINGRKNASYYGFLQAIGEEGLPSFDVRQEAFVKYVSEMLPIVRPYEYLIVQELLARAGMVSIREMTDKLASSVKNWSLEAFHHALRYMLASGFFSENNGELSFAELRRDMAFETYLQDLLDYGLGKYDVDFYDVSSDEVFHIWAKYRKEQVQQLLLNNPGDIMKGTKVYDGVVYVYVTVIKDEKTKETLKYADGYIDANTFQWESEANISETALSELKKSKCVHVFVRKVDSEDNIQLPFTYIGKGKLEYIDGSRKENGAHLFRIPMEQMAPEDIYFDFKLPDGRGVSE